MSNMSIADLLNLGRSAMLQGRPDQAITLLTSACMKQSTQPAPDPRPWFHAAASYAMNDQHDVACLLFLKAKLEARSYLNHPKTPPSALATVSQIQSASKQNLWQSLEKAGGPYKSMLPALYDEAGYVKPWREALQTFAKLLTSQTTKPESEEGSLEAQVVVKGGNGWQALLLADLIRASSPMPEAPSVSLHVTDRIADAWVRTLLLSNRNLSSSTAVEVKRILPKNDAVSDQVCEAAIRSWHLSLGLEADQQASGNKVPTSTPRQSLFIFPDACTPTLSLVKLALDLSKASKAAGSQSSVSFSPSKVTVWGCLVHSQDLITMNEVVTTDMMEDTGLDYGLCNELLWRPNRIVQVDRFPHAHHSAPTELLSISVSDLISPDRRKILNQKKSVNMTVSKDGLLDCLLCWIDYQLCGIASLSFAPKSISAGMKDDHPCLSTHSSQRAFYFPMKPELRIGQMITIDLSLENDSLRFEIDEDSLHSGLDKVAELCPGELIHDKDEDDDAVPAKKDKKDDGKSNQLQIPAYHMSMLNDRERTQRYRDAIKEAVSKLSSPSDLILDIGTGTGLLSMMAAKAGATNILAFEREPSLALTASSLINANGFGDHIEVVNRNCQDISFGEGKAAMVIHEIFGSDPLSEQILPTMRFVQDNMTSQSTRFVPSKFKSIASLAWSGGKVSQAHCKAPSSDGIGLDMKFIEEFTPWKVEANLVDLDGLKFLSEPCEVLHFNLEERPLPMEGSSAAKASMCAPTSPEEFVALGGHCLPLDSAKSDGVVADCIVSWFHADMGEGGWLSTAPGRTTRHGHWVQTIQFIEPIKVDKKAAKKGSVSIMGSYQKDRCIFTCNI